MCVSWTVTDEHHPKCPLSPSSFSEVLLIRPIPSCRRRHSLELEFPVPPRPVMMPCFVVLGTTSPVVVYRPRNLLTLVPLMSGTTEPLGNQSLLSLEHTSLLPNLIRDLRIFRFLSWVDYHPRPPKRAEATDPTVLVTFLPSVSTFSNSQRTESLLDPLCFRSGKNPFSTLSAGNKGFYNQCMR